MKKTNEEKILEKLDKLVDLVTNKSEEEFEICNGLMWSNSIGKELTWNEAMNYAKNLQEGGYNDWRLPTISELQNVFDYEKGKNKIEWSFNYGTSYWSATTTSSNTQSAWFTYQTSGLTFYSTKVTATYSVRCVRWAKLI